MTSLSVFRPLFLLILLLFAFGCSSPEEGTPDDPVFNDTTPPEFSIGYPSVSDITVYTAEMKVKLNESCNLFYLTVPGGSAAPSAFQVSLLQNYASVLVVQSGEISITGNVEQSIQIAGLNENTQYDIYLAAKDHAYNLMKNPVKLSFKTEPDGADTDPPVWSLGYPLVDNITSSGWDLGLKISESGTAYYLVVADGSTAPTSADVKNQASYSGVPVIQKGSVILSAQSLKNILFSDLSSDTAYDLYVTAEDSLANLMNQPVKMDAKTSAIADITPPEWSAGFPEYLNITYTTADVRFKINESGKGYLLVVPKGAAVPAVGQIKNPAGYTGTVIFQKNIDLTAGQAAAFSVTGLTDNTEYDFYAVGEDGAGNIMKTAASATLKTPEEVVILPEVTGLKAAGGVKKVTLTWTDPASVKVTKIRIIYDGQTVDIAKGVQTAVISGLVDDTQYDFVVKSMDGSGNMTAGVSASAVTSPSAVAYVPYIGPYLGLTTPAPNGTSQTATVLNPATSMVIHYESGSSGFAAKAFYRVKGNIKWTAKAEDLYNDLPVEMGKVHHVTLTSLTPDTEYEYRVLGPSENLSATYSFKTAKTNMDYARFLVIGDQQDEEAKQKWQAIADAIYSGHMNDFDFIISVGDMVKDDETFNGDRFYWWKVFFTKGREILARKPMLPAMGNHDTPVNTGISGHNTYDSNAENTVSFRKYFYINPDMTQPDYYSFSYGNAYFLSVNSEIPVFYGKYPARDNRNTRAAQSAWIQSEANGPAQGKTWSFVYHHVPEINPAGGKDEVAFVRPYTDYYNQKLDWSITGHVHTYQRLRPVTATSSSLTFRSGYGKQNTQGVGYILTAPSGQWPRNSTAPELKTQLASYPQNQGVCAYETGFTIIQINGNTFSMKTYGMGDVDNRNPSGYGDSGQKRLIDAVTYTKTSTVSASSFPECFYRGTSNGWNQTAMTLVADNTWETVVVVTPGESNPRFKFFTAQGGEKWYGDTDKDGKAQSNEELDIAFPSGAGTYRITWNDSARNYTVVKQ